MPRQAMNLVMLTEVGMMVVVILVLTKRERLAASDGGRGCFHHPLTASHSMYCAIFGGTSSLTRAQIVFISYNKIKRFLSKKHFP